MTKSMLWVYCNPTLKDLFSEDNSKAFISFLVGIETETSIRVEYVLPFLNAQQLQKYEEKGNNLSVETLFFNKIESILPGGLRLIGVLANKSVSKVSVDKVINKLEEVDSALSLVSNTLVKVIISDSENIYITTSNGCDFTLGEAFNHEAPAVKQFKGATVSYVIDVGVIVSSTKLRDVMEELNKFEFHIDEDQGKVYVIFGSDGVIELDKFDNSVNTKKYIRYNGRIRVREYPFMDDKFKHQCIRESVARALTAVKPDTCHFQVDSMTNRYLPPLLIYGVADNSAATKVLLDIVPSIDGTVKICDLNKNTITKFDFTQCNPNAALKKQLTQTIAMAVFIAVAAIITGYSLLRN